MFPAFALGLMLALGIVLGLLLAALISAFVSGHGSAGASATATPKGVASQMQSDLTSTQRRDEIEVNTVPEDRDVRISGCGTDPDGFASAQVLISNGGSTRATYYVRVVFTAAGNGRMISDDVASVKHLPPGRTAPVQTVNAVDRAPGETVLCRLGSVSRF